MGHIFRFLDTTGDGTGTKDAAVNGASTAQVFKYVPGARDRTYLHRMLVHIADNLALSADDYGNVTGPLTNGVLVQIRKQVDDTTVLDLCDGVPIKDNSGWSRMCYDMAPDDFGSGTNYVKARWTFSKSGEPIYVQNDEYFCVVVQDDLSTLVEQYFQVQGQVTRY